MPNKQRQADLDASLLQRIGSPLFASLGNIQRDKLYRCSDAALILSVGASTLRRWRMEGKGPRVTYLFDGAPPRYKGSDLLTAMGDQLSVLRNGR